MTQKRFDEYFAKVILENCFPEKFSDLQIADKPDLRYGKEIGIEVTNCMPKEAAEAINLWNRVKKQGEQTPPRILERLEQLKDTVHLEGNKLIWEQGEYVGDDIDNSPIKEFVNAVATKVERLNSVNANYAAMNSYELFVNSVIDVSTFNQIYALLDRIKMLNDKPKKFDNVYLITCNQTLLVFDMANNTFYPIYLYARLERMEQIARNLCKGAKNE